MKNFTLVTHYSTPALHPIIPCLAPHHPMSGTPPSASGMRPSVRYPSSMFGTPSSMSGIPPSLSGTHLCLGIPPHYWNPTPPAVWYPTPVPHCHHLAHSTLPLSGHCCSYLASNCLLPPDLAPTCRPS